MQVPNHPGASSKYDTATVLEVLEASEDRVQPRCSAAGVCGGCSLQHMADAIQIHAKQQVLLENLMQIGKVSPKSVLPPLQGLTLELSSQGTAWRQTGA